MSSNSDPIVSANDWSQVALVNKWWVQAVATFVVIPVGLALIIFAPAYQNRKGQVERIGKGTKSILAVLAILVVGFNLVRWAASGASADLAVTDRGILGLLIKNVGDGPVEIQDVLFNDRVECTKPQPAMVLKVGSITAWPSDCISKVRATIKTDQGTFTYTFGR